MWIKIFEEKAAVADVAQQVATKVKVYGSSS
jgi:hypothetical protein